jgi:hypothetical protein
MVCSVNARVFSARSSGVASDKIAPPIGLMSAVTRMALGISRLRQSAQTFLVCISAPPKIVGLFSFSLVPYDPTNLKTTLLYGPATEVSNYQWTVLKIFEYTDPNQILVSSDFKQIIILLIIG